MDPNLTDESGLPGEAASLVFPRSLNELMDAVAAARAAGVRLTVQGGKTGFCGGAVPAGGTVVNLSRMDAATGFRYDAETGTGSLSVQAGCTLERIDEGLRRKNFDTAQWDDASKAAWERYAQARGTLWFPPNPTEKTATAGGIAATGACGSRAPLPGGLAAHVEEITLVLPDGGCLRVGRKDPADSLFGTEALRLLCGSEGTLGVLAELVLSLSARPETVCGFLSFHQSFLQASSFLAGLTADATATPGATLLAADWFDAHAYRAAARHAEETARPALPDFPAAASVCLWLEFSGEEESLFAVFGRALERLEQGEGLSDPAYAATDDRERERLGCLRHAATEQANRLTAGTAAPVLDWIAPAGAWAETADAVASLLAAEGICFFMMGHAVDGRSTLRFPAFADQADAVRADVHRIADLLRAAGCRSSGEHGYGILKRDWFRALSPAEAAAWHSLRLRVDPTRMLNPGVKTDEHE